MDSMSAPMHLSTGVTPHAPPVLRGSEVPSRPVIATVPPPRLVACGSCQARVPSATYCGACGEKL